jgi:hypothetical protein
MRKTSIVPILGALAMLATAGSTFAIVSIYPQAAHAQTQGMEHRGERRGTRQDSRTVKHECNANTDKSRAECRQTKRHVKQEGRGY